MFPCEILHVHSTPMGAVLALPPPLPSLNAPVGPQPLAVLLPGDGRPEVAVDGAGQVDAAADGKPRPARRIYCTKFWRENTFREALP